MRGQDGTYPAWLLLGKAAASLDLTSPAAGVGTTAVHQVAYLVGGVWVESADFGMGYGRLPCWICTKREGSTILLRSTRWKRHRRPWRRPPRPTCRPPATLGGRAASIASRPDVARASTRTRVPRPMELLIISRRRRASFTGPEAHSCRYQGWAALALRPRKMPRTILKTRWEAGIR
jgi:hypothetical protein